VGVLALWVVALMPGFLGGVGVPTK